MRHSLRKDTPEIPWFVVVFLIFLGSSVRSLTVGRGRVSENATVEDVKTPKLLLTEEGGNENSEVLRRSNGTERNSRQLWSVIQNVVDKYKTEKNENSNKPALGGALGSLASSFIGNFISSGIASNLGSSSSSSSIGNQNQFYQHPYHDPVSEPQAPPPTNPNDYMHYLLLNSQANQHSSVPHYQKQQYEQSTSDLIEKYKEQMASSSSSTLGNHGDPIAASSSIASTGNQILSKLALGSILDDGGLEKFSNFLSFGSFERMMEKVNKFDKLKCIPRLLCQMVAKRQEDAKLAESTSTTTTRRPGKAKRRKSDDDEDDNDHDKDVTDEVSPTGEEKKEKTDDEKGEDDQESQTKSGQNNPAKKQSREEESNENDNDEDDDDDGDDDDDAEDDEENDSEEKEYTVIKGGGQHPKQEGRRSGRIFKLNGADAALGQFVNFLELMQLKDWSLYPYVNGAYQGHQVDRTEDCAYKFPSCPFSDDQLVYYFNNYNGGFFQSI